MRFAKLSFAGLVAALMGTLPAQAETPRAVMYQGALFDGDLAAEGDFDVTFKLYSRKNGGRELAHYDASAVPVSQGLFTVDVSDLFENIDAAEIWIEVAVKNTSDNDYD